MEAYLYTQPGCLPCEEAKALLAREGRLYQEIVVDNPMLELGIGTLFRDSHVHTPLLFAEGEGIYVLSPSLPRQWRRLVDMRQEAGVS